MNGGEGTLQDLHREHTAQQMRFPFRARAAWASLLLYPSASSLASQERKSSPGSQSAQRSLRL